MSSELDEIMSVNQNWDKELARKFQFSEDWFEIGILNARSLESIEREFNESDDPHLEHYRWRAFSDYLKNSRDLTEDQIIALHKMSEKDPDTVLSGAMIRTLLDVPNCPASILNHYLESEEKFLRVAADRAIKRRKES